VTLEVDERIAEVALGSEVHWHVDEVEQPSVACVYEMLYYLWLADVLWKVAHHQCTVEVKFTVWHAAVVLQGRADIIAAVSLSVHLHSCGTCAEKSENWGQSTAPWQGRHTLVVCGGFILWRIRPKVNLTTTAWRWRGRLISFVTIQRGACRRRCGGCLHEFQGGRGGCFHAFGGHCSRRKARLRMVATQLWRLVIKALELKEGVLHGEPDVLAA